jgi:hypothetical protein
MVSNMRSGFFKGWSDGVAQYQFGPGRRLTFIAPDECKNRHVLRPGDCVIGWSLPDCHYVTCNRCRIEERQNHTIYLREPTPEEFKAQRRRAGGSHHADLCS